MRFYVIGDEETVLGFSLCGIEGRVVSTRVGCGQALESALTGGDVGVILITERVANLARDLLEPLIYGARFPLILEIPDRHGPLEGRPTIREVARSAIGVSV